MKGIPVRQGTRGAHSQVFEYNIVTREFNPASLIK